MDKTDVRRQKNRESAARCRQKIKGRLTTLEKSLKQQADRKDQLFNEKKLIQQEINNLETELVRRGLLNMDQCQNNLK